MSVQVLKKIMEKKKKLMFRWNVLQLYTCNNIFPIFCTWTVTHSVEYIELKLIQQFPLYLLHSFIQTKDKTSKKKLWFFKEKKKCLNLWTVHNERTQITNYTNLQEIKEMNQNICDCRTNFIIIINKKRNPKIYN